MASVTSGKFEVALTYQVTAALLFDGSQVAALGSEEKKHDAGSEGTKDKVYFVRRLNFERHNEVSCEGIDLLAEGLSWFCRHSILLL
jgi:hypothetical protein